MRVRAEDADAAYGVYEKPEEGAAVEARDEDADAAYGVYAKPGSTPSD